MNDMSANAGTAIAIPGKADLEAMFRAENGLDPLVAMIEAKVRAHVPDLSTRKGRDEIKSLAYMVARSKTALDDAGKALNEEVRTQINAVDAARRSIREKLDALRDEARKPLDDWEAAEEARVKKLKDRLERVRLAHTMLPEDPTSEQIAALLARVEGIEIDGTWSEFADDAGRYKAQAVTTLQHLRDATAERERQAAELEALRREKAEREEADRLSREAAEEAERVRLEAERAERDRIAAEKAEADRLARVEAEKQEAARIAAEQAEARAKAEAERAAREAAEREAAMARAQAEAEARHKREMEEAKAREEAAAQAERDRIAAEHRAAQMAADRRAADQAHRKRIRDAIAAALASMAGAATPEAIADALMAGKIPHCEVKL